jgi:acyl carrier protein
MTQSAAPDRTEVIAMLASFGERSPDEVAEQISSLELTWLITKVELKYGVTIDFSDETLAQMSTVGGVVDALRGAITTQDHG